MLFNGLCFDSDLQVAFSLFDKNQDGNISCDEVEEVMRSVGVKVNRDKVKKMFDKADSDGKLQYTRGHTMANNGVILWQIMGSYYGK